MTRPKASVIAYSAALGAVLAVTILAFGQLWGDSKTYRVRSLRAVPYHEEDGGFGREDLLSGRLALRNVPIGEGDVEAASNITLVTVEVEGPGFPTKGSERLRLVAQSGDVVALDQRVPLALSFSRSGRIWVPFIVYGTGCEPLALTASVEPAGDQSAAPVTGTVPFTCGE